ncbi:MAG: S1 RNA-binding domain-containing protein, partial [Bacteroidales bacterium]|nr:S1 RNA-binding domain-containing protein [Bacteroidales bacterium]
LSKVKAIVAVPELNEVYKGVVKGITTFGAFVEILPNHQGLLHISEIDWKRIKSVEEVLKEGQEIEVKLIDIDQKTGKFKLSRKALLPRPPKEERPENK